MGDRLRSGQCSWGHFECSFRVYNGSLVCTIKICSPKSASQENYNAMSQSPQPLEYVEYGLIAASLVGLVVTLATGNPLIAVIPTVFA